MPRVLDGVTKAQTTKSTRKLAARFVQSVLCMAERGRAAVVVSPSISPSLPPPSLTPSIHCAFDVRTLSTCPQLSLSSPVVRSVPVGEEEGLALRSTQS